MCLVLYSSTFVLALSPSLLVNVQKPSLLASATMTSSAMGFVMAPPAAASHARKLRAQPTHEDAPSRKDARSGDVDGDVEITAVEAHAAPGSSNDRGGNVRTLAILSAQLAMQASAAAKVAKSATIDMHVMERDHAVIQKAKAATTAYFDGAKLMDAAAKAAAPPPYVVVWDATMSACLEVARQHKMEREAAAISKHIEQVAALPSAKARVDFVTESVRHCRVAPAFAKDKAKLEVSVVWVDMNNNEYLAFLAWQAAKAVLRTHCSAQKKAGMAPRNNIERKISTLVSKMGVSNGGGGQTRGEW